MFTDKAIFFAQVIFDAVPDLKQPFATTKRQPSFLVPCDSQRELLIGTERLDNADDEQPELPSPSGLRRWKNCTKY